MFENIVFTPEGIAAIAGVIMVVVFAYVPKLRTAYAKLASHVKALIMVGLIALTAAVIWLLSAYSIIQTDTPVTWQLYVALVLSVLKTYAPAYLLTPKTVDVQNAVARRDATMLKLLK
jgi:hypothetical protein